MVTTIVENPAKIIGSGLETKTSFARTLRFRYKWFEERYEFEYHDDAI